MRRKKIIMKIAGIIIIVLLAGALAAGYVLSGFILQANRQTLEEAIAWQKDHYDISWFDGIDTDEYTVAGYEGYTLHVMLCRNTVVSDKYIIISHGHTDNRYGDLKYMKMYLDLGFNCVVYDLRGHGENERTPCTYGVKEGQDLVCLIEDTRERYGKDIRLGLHGESLGSATTVSALGSTQDVAFAVADCGFVDISGVLAAGLPGPILKLASLGAKMRCGIFLGDMRPIDALAENKVPILFIHGAEDAFILPSNSERMSAATRGESFVRLIPGAGHAESVLKEPGMYKECVEEFFKEIGV